MAFGEDVLDPKVNGELVRGSDGPLDAELSVHAFSVRRVRGHGKNGGREVYRRRAVLLSNAGVGSVKRQVVNLVLVLVVVVKVVDLRRARKVCVSYVVAFGSPLNHALVRDEHGVGREDLLCHRSVGVARRYVRPGRVRVLSVLVKGSVRRDYRLVQGVVRRPNDQIAVYARRCRAYLEVSDLERDCVFAGRDSVIQNGVDQNVLVGSADPKLAFVVALSFVVREARQVPKVVVASGKRSVRDRSEARAQGGKVQDDFLFRRFVRLHEVRDVIEKREHGYFVAPNRSSGLVFRHHPVRVLGVYHVVVGLSNKRQILYVGSVRERVARSVLVVVFRSVRVGVHGGLVPIGVDVVRLGPLYLHAVADVSVNLAQVRPLRDRKLEGDEPVLAFRPNVGLSQGPRAVAGDSRSHGIAPIGHFVVGVLHPRAEAPGRERVVFRVAVGRAVEFVFRLQFRRGLERHPCGDFAFARRYFSHLPIDRGDGVSKAVSQRLALQQDSVLFRLAQKERRRVRASDLHFARAHSRLQVFQLRLADVLNRHSRRGEPKLLYGRLVAGNVPRIVDPRVVVDALQRPSSSVGLGGSDEKVLGRVAQRVVQDRDSRAR